MTDDQYNDLYWSIVSRYDYSANFTAVIGTFARAVLEAAALAREQEAQPAKDVMDHEYRKGFIDGQLSMREQEAQPKRTLQLDSLEFSCDAYNDPPGSEPVRVTVAAQPAAQEPSDAKAYADKHGMAVTNEWMRGFDFAVNLAAQPAAQEPSADYRAMWQEQVSLNQRLCAAIAAQPAAQGPS